MHRNLVVWILLLVAIPFASAFPSPHGFQRRNHARHQALQELHGRQNADPPSAPGQGCPVNGYQCNGAEIQRKFTLRTPLRQNGLLAVLYSGCDHGVWTPLATCATGELCFSDGTNANCAPGPSGGLPTIIPSPTGSQTVYLPDITPVSVPKEGPTSPISPQPPSSTLGTAEETSPTLPVEQKAHTPPLISSAGTANEETPLKENAPKGAVSAPHYVVYADWGFEGLPSVADLKGFNRLMLAFWMIERPKDLRPNLIGPGPYDKAEYWSNMTSSEQLALKAEYTKAGISVMVSAFGATGMLVKHLQRPAAERLPLLHLQRLQCDSCGSVCDRKARGRLCKEEQS